MATPVLSDEVCAEAIQLVARHGSISGAARAAGIPPGTLQRRIERARERPHLWPGGVVDPGLARGGVPRYREPAPPPEPRRVEPDPVALEDFESAWRVWMRAIGMAEDRYYGPAKQRHGPRTKTLVLSDLHAPFHDAGLVADAMARHADADRLVLAGDLGDGYGWSRFTKYESVTYEEEIAAVTLLVQEASQRFAEVVVIDGNHDGPRLERQLRERLEPDMVAAIQFMTGGILSPVHALCARYPNVRIAGHTMPDGRRVGWLVVLGDCVITHAEKFSITPGAATRKIEEWLSDMAGHMRLPAWRLLVQAHTHQLSWIPWHSDRLLVESGCMCCQHGYQLQAKIGGRPQRRGYVTFEQVEGRTDLNSVHLHWYDAD